MMSGYVKARPRKPLFIKRDLRKTPLNLVPIDIPFPLPGLHYDKPRDQVPPGAAIDTDGIRLYGGSLLRSPGYSKYGAALDGAVMRLCDYIDSTGNTTSMAISTKSLYKYSGGAWTKIPKNPAADLTGTTYDLFWTAQIGSTFVFCQGKDPVMAWGEGADFAILNANCPTATHGVDHEGRLLLAHTTEGGTTYPYRVRWNVVDDLLDWTGAGSGYVDLLDSQDHVKGICIINELPVVFKEKTICVGQRTYLASPAYDFKPRDTKNGTNAPFAIVSLGNEAMYIGQDDIYVFDLNNSIPIGGPIRDRFFGSMTPTRVGECYGYYDNEHKEVHFCTPSGATTYNNHEWIFSLIDKTWIRRRRDINCVGTHLRTASLTWADFMSTPWTNMSTPWNDRSLLQQYPMVLIGNRSGQIYLEDSLLASNDGVGIESFYTFGDFRLDLSKISGVSYIEIRHKDVGIACPLRVDLSKDGGATWESKTANLRYDVGSGAIMRTSVFKQFSGETITLRLYTNDATSFFDIVGLRAWCTPVGTYVENS